MKPLFTIVVCLTFNLAFGQSKLSQHKISFYVNDVEQKIIHATLKIFIANDTIYGEKSGDHYSFPILNDDKEFKIEVEINKTKLLAGPFKAWCLNHGTRLILGKLTKMTSITSIANYYNMDSTDKSWQTFSKRYFIINRAHTIDLENINRIKELNFLILNPKSDGDGVTFMTQKIIKTK
jgi:hypothetical protein